MTGEHTTRRRLDDPNRPRGRIRADAPEGEDLGAEFWASAEIVEPQPKTSVHLRVDPEVFAFFKSQGRGHLTRMNAVLKAYVQAHQTK